MHRSARIKVLFFFNWILISSFSADAAEIRLLRRCTCNRSLVRVKDVAQVITQDPYQAEVLASMPLFPTPSIQRILSRQQIQSLLSLQGVDLSSCRFTGAPTVRILPAQSEPTATRHDNQQLAGKASQRVERAILTYLQSQDSQNSNWQISASFDDRYASLIAEDQHELAIDGGQRPWTKRQSFELTVQTPEGARRIPVTAGVTAQQMVAFTRRKLERGELLRAEDVQLRPIDSPINSGDFLHRVEDVIGREAQRTISPTEPIRRTYVRLPWLVRRGEIVTVYAIASGIRVRTTATVLSDASLGDLVTIQPQDKKQKISARVTGLREVEVFASGTRVN